MDPAKRVVKNTFFLYGRMLITILISLLSTRLILNALGKVDYGIFNLVGSIIAMLMFINGAMTLASSRYLNIALGSGNIEKVKSVFSSSVVLHLILSFIIVLILETAGLFLFDGALNIPAERINTAKVIFHFMVVNTFFTINAVPYDASIMAHENFLFDAVLGIIESFLKLGIAVWLIYTNIDKLIFYGLLMACMTIGARIVKGIYCHRKYEECRINVRSHVRIPLFKEMLAFAWWNMFGLFCGVLKNQGLAILLNLFFGILVNAAYGIANTVNSNIRHFSSVMIRATMPQITKSEGSGNRERMLKLSVFTSKMSFFLLAFFAVPIIVEAPYILKLWLKTVPENAVIFCQLILILSLAYQITIGTMAAVTSVGNIKKFQIAVGAFEVLNLPVAWALLKLGLPVYSVFAGAIILELIAGIIRTWFAHKIAGLDMKDFLVKTWFYSLASAVLTGLIAVLLRFLIDEGMVRLIIVCIFTSLSLIMLGKYFVLTFEENAKITEIIQYFFLNARKKIVVNGI